MAGKPLTRYGKICGAMNRRGLPCQCKAVFRGGKCKYHGGLSTGPKTPEGKIRAIAAMREGFKRYVEKRRSVAPARHGVQATE